MYSLIGILLTVVVLNAYVTLSFHYCIWNFVYLFNPGLKIFVGKVSNSYVELYEHTFTNLQFLKLSTLAAASKVLPLGE